VIVGLAVAIGTASGSRPAVGRSASPSPSPASSAPSLPPAASVPPPSGTPSPTSTRVTVRWHGTLTLSGSSAHKDLDSIPPRTYPRDSDIRGNWLHTSVTTDAEGTQLALVTDGTPDAARCRDEVAANGTDQWSDSLQAGDVVCITTSQGRIARLTVLSAEVPDVVPVLKFDVTVWDPPVAG
jgi:hypothetical protein